MKTINLIVTDKAWKKIRTSVMTKSISCDGELHSTSDIVLSLIIEKVDKGVPVTIMAKNDPEKDTIEAIK